MQTSIFVKIMQGALIGLAAILPGISGGVLSVVFGIYKPIMELLSAPKERFQTHFPKLLPYFLGYALGFFVVARILGFFLTSYPNESLCLFTGLILGTLPSLYRQANNYDRTTNSSIPAGKHPLQTSKHSPLFWSTISASFLFVLLLFLKKGQFSIQPNLYWFLFCGVCLALSIIAPGLSFSTLLMPLGLYTPFVDGIGHFSLPILLSAGVGFILTICLLSSPINRLYDQYPYEMGHLIVGIVFAATIMVVPFSALSEAFYSDLREFVILVLYLGIGSVTTLFSK